MRLPHPTALCPTASNTIITATALDPNTTTSTTATIASSNCCKMTSPFHPRPDLTATEKIALRSKQWDGQRLAELILGRAIKENEDGRWSSGDLLEAIQAFAQMKSELDGLRRESTLWKPMSSVATTTTETMTTTPSSTSSNSAKDSMSTDLFREEEKTITESESFDSSQDQDSQEWSKSLAQTGKDIPMKAPSFHGPAADDLLNEFEDAVAAWQSKFEAMNRMFEQEVQRCVLHLDQFKARLQSVEGSSGADTVKKAEQRLQHLVKVVEAYPFKARVDQLELQLKQAHDRDQATKDVLEKLQQQLSVQQELLDLRKKVSEQQELVRAEKLLSKEREKLRRQRLSEIYALQRSKTRFKIRALINSKVKSMFGALLSKKDPAIEAEVRLPSQAGSSSQSSTEQEQTNEIGNSNDSSHRRLLSTSSYSSDFLSYLTNSVASHVEADELSDALTPDLNQHLKHSLMLDMEDMSYGQDAFLSDDQISEYQENEDWSLPCTESTTREVENGIMDARKAPQDMESWSLNSAVNSMMEVVSYDRSSAYQEMEDRSRTSTVNSKDTTSVDPGSANKRNDSSHPCTPKLKAEVSIGSANQDKNVCDDELKNAEVTHSPTQSTSNPATDEDTQSTNHLATDEDKDCSRMTDDSSETSTIPEPCFERRPRIDDKEDNILTMAKRFSLFLRAHDTEEAPDAKQEASTTFPQDDKLRELSLINSFALIDL